MAVSKVIFGGNTLIDITDTTATADKLLTGYYFYGPNGVKIYGQVLDGDTLKYGDNTVPIADVGQADYMVLENNNNLSDVVEYATVGHSKI